MDKIFVHEMRFYGYHGVFPEETRLGQRFTVDLELGLDLTDAAQSDELQHTVDYGAIYETVRCEMEGEPVKLIETLAGRIIQQLFSKFPRLQEITIRVTKPDPPIPGHYRSVAVQLHRVRGQENG